MDIKMINPVILNQSEPGYDHYTLVFSGFEGIGNIDEDGDEFYYYCCMYRDAVIGIWEFYADKMYEDDHVEADFTASQMQYIKEYMHKQIALYDGAYGLLRYAEENGYHTIEIMEKQTGKVGVANSCENGIAVFYGADDGSDDCIVSSEAFNKRFIVTEVIR